MSADVMSVAERLIEILHCCDTEAQVIADRISGDRNAPCRHPDGVQVLEDAEALIRAAAALLVSLDESGTKSCVQSISTNLHK